MQNERINNITNKLLEMFTSGDMPKAAARTIIAAREDLDIPCYKWSVANRILTILAGTDDARGFRQWEQVGRKVVKGAKAFYILAPSSRKITRTERDPKTGKEIKKEDTFITFRAVPVFRYEDTDGEPIPEHNYQPSELPPLYDVAQQFGIPPLYDVAQQFGKVNYLPGISGGPLGSCSVITGDMKLFSHDVEVFFHELAHSVDRVLHGLKGGQDPTQEIVAEFTSSVLCYIYGYEGFIPHTWSYIQMYAGGNPNKALAAIIKVLNRVEAIVNRILEVKDNLAGKAVNF